MTDTAVYLTLFLNAFVAATLLPAYSELTLAGLLATGTGGPLWLLIAATAGNVGGSIVNWWLGRGIARFQDRKWFPVSREQYARGCDLFGRFGLWTLLFAWLPIVGDPLTLVAGTLRVKFLPFLLLVTIGKAARYAIIVISVQAVTTS